MDINKNYLKQKQDGSFLAAVEWAKVEISGG